jgi:hypothetical protein
LMIRRSPFGFERRPETLLAGPQFLDPRRASYWRRQARSAVRATLTSVPAWKGRSRNVTFPRTSVRRARASLPLNRWST